MVAAATRAAGGEPVLVPGMGGSLPIYLFTQFLGKPCLIVPVANHDNNQHAPDENLRLANLWYAIDLYGAGRAPAPACGHLRPAFDRAVRIRQVVGRGHVGLTGQTDGEGQGGEEHRRGGQPEVRS